jgi:hypothetical protein
MNDKNLNLRRDLLGIVLFAAGAFLSVVVGMCYWKGAAASDYAGSFFVDKELIRWFGRPACLVLGVVACATGARLFLSGHVRNVARSLLIGGVCLALGTSILMGALNPEFGGLFGQLIGTWASANLSKVVGIPLGLICVFAPVWFAWLRPSDGEAEKAVRELAPSADRSTEATSGVTAEEAAELIPRRTQVQVRTDGGAGPRPAVAAARPLDPQQKAPVPTGAKALESTHDPLRHTHPTPASAVSERPAADLPLVGEPFGEDLVDAGSAQEPTGKRSLVVQPVDELEEVGPAIPLTAAPPAAPRPLAEQTAKSPLETAAFAASAELAAPLAAASETTPSAGFTTLAETPARPLAHAPITRPSWESSEDTSAETETDTGDDIPVDAYGTPLTLVEELRRDSTVRAAAAKEDALEEAAREAGVDDEDQDEALAGEEAPRYEVAVAASGVALAVDEQENDPEVDPLDDDEELEEARGDAGADVDEDGDDSETAPPLSQAASGSVAADPAPAVATAPPAPIDAAIAADDDAAADAAAADDDDGNELEELEDELASASEESSEDDDEPAEDEEETLRREAPLFAVPRAVARPADSAGDDAAADDEGAEDEEADVVSATDDEETEVATAAPIERDVVLQPKPAPVPEPARAASDADDEEDADGADADEEDEELVAEALVPETEAELSEEDELVYKAGVLFLERQRVAVSMLQREFGLDFEQATHVLDRLQAAGLIGPYLGGQRRDILLTLEQWQRRAVAH